MSSRSIDDLRDLSDEDVRLLYDIVTAAESSQSPPFRALFTAYDRILGQRGIAKENEQLYLRFLLRMGEGRKEGKGLFEQFETLLDKLGFQVAFDGEDQENELQVEERFAMQDQDMEPSSSPPRIRLLQTTSFRPARRASFDSAYDTNMESKPLPTLPVRALSTDAIRNKTSVSQLSAKHSVQHASRGMNSLQQLPRPSTGTGLSYLAKNTVREPHESDETLAGESNDDDSAIATKSFEISRELPHEERELNGHKSEFNAINPSAPQETLKLHKAQLEADARTLRYHHIAAHAVWVFRNWCDLARDARFQHQRMSDDARKRDTTVLRRQAFDQWRIVFKEKQHRNENERFFLNLEHQASKARDMYLLTKAFTHWAGCASDEVFRRTEARSKMLQARYFKAWHDITAVNELKVRRLALSKFLYLWIRRTEHAYRQEEQALEFSESNALSKTYRRWFWQFCEQRTPAWYISRLQAKIFGRWLDSTRGAQAREAWAIDFRSLELTGKSFNQWTIRSTAIQEGHVQAENFRRQALLGMTADALQREIRFTPLQSELSLAVDSRLARSAFASWRSKSQMSLQATTVNRLRIMRNAWTKWNDRLRCQALTNVINDRLVLQALYRWVLAERLELCERSSNDGLKERSLRLWQSKLNEKASSLGKANHSLTAWRDKKSALSILRLWSTKSQARRGDEKQAQTVRNRNLLSSALTSWESGSQHITRLSKWSNDASFYVLCSRSIKLWHSTTLASKKSRRREAFANFQVKVQINNARCIIKKWRATTGSILSMQRRAAQTYEQRLLSVGTEIYHSWRQRLSIVQDQSNLADAVWQEHVLIHCLDSLNSRHKQILDSESRAVELVAAHAENKAASCLRKLNWKSFQLKRHQESADSLYHRTQRRHYRDMLRYWALSAKNKRQQTGDNEDNGQLDDSILASVPANPNMLYTRTSKSNHRSPFSTAKSHGSQLAALTHSTHQGSAYLPRTTEAVLPSTPGYLRTPSRRTVSSRWATQTPATSSITPFMSRLRAQYSTGAPPSSRHDLSFHSDKNAEGEEV